MKKVLITTISLFMLFSGATWAGSDMAMQEGQWEMTIETEMQGMPMKMPPTTFSQCITQQDPVPQSQQPGQQCVVKDVVTSGSTVTWTQECDTPGGKMTGKGEITYSKTSMKGTSTVTMQSQGMTIISRFQGRYLGPCEK